MHDALYLHVPFCVRRCRYCDFATSAVAHGDALVGAYVDALAELVGRTARCGLLADVKTAYIGGGTPTMAGDGLARLARQVTEAAPCVGEFSTEANPESLNLNLAMSLRDSGVTRISLGIQSLVEAELERLGRAHDPARARRAMADVRAARLDLSCDLMCGIPLQTTESWRASLRGVLEGGACHVSCYPLMVEEGTPLFHACETGEEYWPDDDLQADLMVEAERVLEASGLSRYEVASYALPGHACRHNVAYWTGAPYLGLGTSAASMLPPVGFAAFAEAASLSCAPEDPGGADPALWGTEGADGFTDTRLAGTELARRIEALGEERVARVRLRMTDPARDLARRMRDGGPLAISVETLSLRESIAEDLMLAMRTSAGAPSDLLAYARAEMGDALDVAVDGACSRDLAHLTASGALVPTERGWLLGNELFGTMWGLASVEA